MYDQTISHDNKMLVTTNLVEHIQFTNPDRVYKTYLCLPSLQQYDVKYFKKFGLIDNDTLIIAIEKDTSLIRKVKGRLKKQGFKNIHVINKDMCDINTDELSQILEQHNREDIDLMYIDTCNCLTDCMQGFISGVLNNIKAHDGTFIINLQAGRWVKAFKHYKTNVIHTLFSVGSEDGRSPYFGQMNACLDDKIGYAPCYAVNYKEFTSSVVMHLAVFQAHVMLPLYSHVSGMAKSSFADDELTQGWFKYKERQDEVINIGYID